MSIAATAKPGSIEEDGIAVFALVQHIATVGANPVWLADAADAAARVAEQIWPQVNAFHSQMASAPHQATSSDAFETLFGEAVSSSAAAGDGAAPAGARPKRPIARSQVQEALAAAMLFAVRQLSSVDLPHVNAALWLQSLQAQVAMRLSSAWTNVPPASAFGTSVSTPESSSSILPSAKTVTIALALASAAVVAPMAARLSTLRNQRDLHTLFLDMDDASAPPVVPSRSRAGGIDRATATTEEHQMPKPGMASAWLTTYFNAAIQPAPAPAAGGRDGLTPSSAPVVQPSMPFHNRSFLGVQARRVRLRWTLLPDSGTHLVKKQWRRWVHMDPAIVDYYSYTQPVPPVLLARLFRVPLPSPEEDPMRLSASSFNQGVVPYPQCRLARPGAEGVAPFHPRKEGEYEARVSAYDRFARSLWSGDRAMAPIALRSFFDYVAPASEHDLHHYALLTLAALQLSSPPPLLSSGPGGHVQNARYAAVDVSSAAQAAAQMAREASSHARLAKDRDAMALCATILSRCAALRMPPSLKPGPADTQGEAQRAFPSRFPPEGVDLALLTPFSGETLWHVSLAYHYARSLGPMQTLNALANLNWPRHVRGAERARSVVSVSASAPGERSLLWGARVHAIYASTHRPRASRARGPGQSTMAVAGSSIVPVTSTPAAQAVPLEPQASIGRDSVRADTLRARIWDAAGNEAVSDVLFAHVLRRSSVPLKVGSAPLPPSNDLPPSARPAALGASPSPSSTAPSWAAAETSPALDGLLDAARRTALGGGYSSALAQLLHPTVVNALPQPSYPRWVSAVGGILALQARRSERLGDLAFLQKEAMLDPAPDVLAPDPRVWAGLPPPTESMPALLTASLANGVPWAREYVSTLGLGDLTALASSASEAAGRANPRESRAVLLAAAATLASSQLAPQAQGVLRQWPSAAAMACVDPNPETRAGAWVDLAHVELGLVAWEAQRDADRDVHVHHTTALEHLDQANKAYAEAGSLASQLKVLGMKALLLRQDAALPSVLDEYAMLEAQVRANRAAAPSALVQRVAALVAKIGLRYVRAKEGEFPPSDTFRPDRGVLRIPIME